MCGIITDCDLNLYIVIIEMKQKKKEEEKEKKRTERSLVYGVVDTTSFAALEEGGRESEVEKMRGGLLS